MKTILIKSFVICLFVMTLIFGSAVFVFADDGCYLGLSYVNNNPGDGFTGDMYYAADGYRIGAPKFKSEAGFTITGGLVVNPIGLEMSYTHSSHSGSCYVPAYSIYNAYNWSGTASFNAIDFNMKLFLKGDSSFKPYSLLGFGFPWVVVKNGEQDDMGSITGDVTYSGIGLNFGGGLDFKVSDQLNFKGEAVYRWASLDSANGANISGTLPESLGGSGLCLTIGINYIVVGFK